jgi:hypothetical protein
MKTQSDVLEVAQSLRLLADFYESHPTVPLPLDLTFNSLNVYVRDDPKTVLASIGSFEKAADGVYFIAKKQIGCFTLEFRTKRDSVCVRKVVGKRVVPAHVIPAEFKEETFIPEHEEDIVEWDCQPILPNSEPEPELEGMER